MIETLSARGAMGILSRLSLGDAKFTDLNKIVINTRTLSRRLKELKTAGLIKKIGSTYKITDRGFNVFMEIRNLKLELKPKWLKEDEFAKLKHNWIKIPLRRLIYLFFNEFGENLISMVLYGSSLKETFKKGGSDIDLLYIIEDNVRKMYERESRIFKLFRSTYEYQAFDRWFKTHDFYGYPEITITGLQKSYALDFRSIYLDMIFHRAILYDREDFFEKLIQRLRDKLTALGAKRVEGMDGVWYWLLKPNLRPGELIEINLRK